MESPMRVPRVTLTEVLCRQCSTCSQSCPSPVSPSPASHLPLCSRNCPVTWGQTRTRSPGPRAATTTSSDVHVEARTRGAGAPSRTARRHELVLHPPSRPFSFEGIPIPSLGSMCNVEQPPGDAGGGSLVRAEIVGELPGGG